MITTTLKTFCVEIFVAVGDGSHYEYIRCSSAVATHETIGKASWVESKHIFGAMCLLEGEYQACRWYQPTRLKLESHES